jgi:hypothetical protein
MALAMALDQSELAKKAYIDLRKAKKRYLFFLLSFLGSL